MKKGRNLQQTSQTFKGLIGFFYFERYYVKFLIGGPLFIFSYNEIIAENFTLHKHQVVKMRLGIICQRTFVREWKSLQSTLHIYS